MTTTEIDHMGTAAAPANPASGVRTLQQARSIEWRGMFALGLVVAGVIATIFWIIFLCAILLRLVAAQLA
jgi:hypothetical protein